MVETRIDDMHMSTAKLAALIFTYDAGYILEQSMIETTRDEEHVRLADIGAVS